MDLLGNQTSVQPACFVHPVVGARPSACDGWNFLCCDRQNIPSGLSGLQLKAEQEHSRGRDWMFGPLAKAKSSHAGRVSPSGQELRRGKKSVN